MLWWVGCAEPELLEPQREPEADLELWGLELVASEQAPIWTVSVSSSLPASLELVVEGGGERRVFEAEPATEHVLQLIGLVPGADHELSGSITRDQTRIELGPLPFATVPVPAAARLPLEILAQDPGRVDPGWLLLAPTVTDLPQGAVRPPLLLLDTALQPRWWLWLPGTYSDLRVGPDGQLWAMAGHGVERLGWDGTLLQRWHPRPAGADHMLPTYRAHHEVWPLPDGSFWTLGLEVVAFDSYPVSYVEPEPVPGEYLVEDNPPLHLGADGALLHRWPLASRFDRARIGFDSLGQAALEGLDWTHANALSPDGEGGLVVSLRNQDAVIRLDAAGELDWILGDPLGWSPDFAERLLAPVPEPDTPWRWFYHQHAPVWHPEERLLVMFDNHQNGYTPYGHAPTGPVASRVVGYEIDAEARTVRQRWSLDQSSTGPLNSSVMGNAQLLPNGNVLANFAQVALPEGGYAVRLVEFDPEQPEQPAFDLQLPPDPERAPTGWLLYRAIKIPAF